MDEVTKPFLSSAFPALDFTLAAVIIMSVSVGLSLFKKPPLWDLGCS